MPPPLRQREGRSAQSRAVLTSAGDDDGSDDEYDSDGAEHFSDGGAENLNCRNAIRSLTSKHKCLWLAQK